MTSTIDVKKKQDLKKWLEMPYNNRELSWLDFNARVLEEAFEKENPIMERCNFLSITASNLDEFFMVRVAGVLDNIHRGTNKPDPSGLTPKMQMKKISEKVHAFAEKQYNCYNRSIIPSLRANGINFVKADEMTAEYNSTCCNSVKFSNVNQKDKIEHCHYSIYSASAESRKRKTYFFF